MHTNPLLLSTLANLLAVATAQLSTSTCTRSSIAACPTPYDPCCAFVCAEAQVPFQVCSPNDETVLASCSACPSTQQIALATPFANASTTNTSSATVTTTPPLTTSSATSTCTTPGGIASTGCPTAYDPCCAWVCDEAQVPFAICSQTDGTGEFATCSQCPLATAAP